MRKLFVTVLDYTLNPQVNFNLTSEFKNEKGAKKAEAQALQTETDKTNCEIDQIAYELYGLNQEEIKIVEQA